MLHIVYNILHTIIPAVNILTNRRQTTEKVGYCLPHACTHFLGEASSHPQKADCQDHPRAARSAKPHFSHLSSAADARRTPLPLSIHLRERGDAHAAAAEVWRCAFTTTDISGESEGEREWEHLIPLHNALGSGITFNLRPKMEENLFSVRLLYFCAPTRT